MIFGSNQKLLMARAGAIPVDRSWDVTYSSFSQQSPTLSDVSGDITGLYIKDDGLTAWVSGSNAYIYEYTMSAAWDISTISYTGNSFLLSTRASFVTFKTDGSVVYSADSIFGRVRPANLSTSWDITTASLGTRVSGFPAVQSLRFKEDGLKIMTAGSDEFIREYSLSTAWDLSTASLTNSFSTAGTATNPSGVYVNPDGNSVYITANNDLSVFQYTLTTAWDLSTASLYGSKYIGPDYNITDIFFKPDGSKFYASWNLNFIREYNIG